MITIRKFVKWILTFLFWLAVSMATGAVCGLIGALFHHAIDFAAETRLRYAWLLYCLPVGGLVIVFLYKRAKIDVNMGTDAIFEATRAKENVPALMAPLIFISTAITHLLGGSAGREGAALQLGGGIASFLGRRLKMRGEALRVIELCGMSALFSALFGTPLAATFFVLEVVDVGIFEYRALFPCVAASVTAHKIAGILNVSPTRFALTANVASADALTLAQTALIAAACGLIAILFCLSMHAGGKYLKKWLHNDYLRAALGGIAVVILSLMFGTRAYNGAGMEEITHAVGGQARPEAWILKLLLTCITLSAGYKGGEIVPSFFVGATFGCAAGALIGIDPGIAAAIGMIALFCGVTNTPAASLILSVEMFGSEYFLLFGVAVGVSYLISGKCSLYHSQTIANGKLVESQETGR